MCEIYKPFNNWRIFYELYTEDIIKIYMCSVRKDICYDICH